MVIKNPIITSELSINHLGMINIAKAMIKSSKDSGATIVKLKYKNVNKYYGDTGKKWRNMNFKKYRQSLELDKKDFENIVKYCSEIDIGWFCTVHDLEGLEFIKQFNPDMYKIASMDSDNSVLVKAVMDLCKSEDKPFVVSIGGKSDQFTSNLVKQIKSYDIKAFILHTVSIYPTPHGRSNINYIKKLKQFESEKIKIGYSGHEIGYAATLLSVTMGVSMIERHFTLSRDYKIHHIKSGLIPSEFKNMCDIINNITSECNCNIVEYDSEENKFLKDKIYK